MRVRRSSWPTLFLTLAVTLTAGCSGGPNSSPTSAAPCELKCNVTAEGYSFGVSCESGEFSRSSMTGTDYEYGAGGGMSKANINVDETQVYKSTNNTYKIKGKITLSRSPGARQLDAVSYDISATGGAFGETPRTCRQ
jgi:hypothetical protein